MYRTATAYMMKHHILFLSVNLPLKILFKQNNVQSNLLILFIYLRCINKYTFFLKTKTNNVRASAAAETYPIKFLMKWYTVNRPVSLSSRSGFSAGNVLDMSLATLHTTAAAAEAATATDDGENWPKFCDGAAVEVLIV